ncbi:MAG: hypothetical protein ACR2OW_08470 [Methyloligellaceae bacterium]
MPISESYRTHIRVFDTELQKIYKALSARSRRSDNARLKQEIYDLLDLGETLHAFHIGNGQMESALKLVKVCRYLEALVKDLS